MTAVRKFLFDRRFDAEDEAAPDNDEAGAAAQALEAEDEARAESAAEEPDEETAYYTEDDLAIARQEGFEAGKLEGARDAAATTESETLRVLTGISQHLTELFGHQEQANAALTRDAIGIAAAIARKMLPDLNKRNALGEVTHVVEQMLHHLIEEPRIVIHVNPELHGPLSERIDGMSAGAGYEGRIVLQEDAAVAYGDCRIEWSNGSAERNTAALWQTIDEIVERNLAGSLPGAEAPGPAPLEVSPAAAAPDPAPSEPEAPEPETGAEEAGDDAETVFEADTAQQTPPDGRTESAEPAAPAGDAESAQPPTPSDAALAGASDATDRPDDEPASEVAGTDGGATMIVDDDLPDEEGMIDVPGGDILGVEPESAALPDGNPENGEPGGGARNAESAPGETPDAERDH